MNYLVAVLSDRIQAEAAYTALEKEGIPIARVTILGKGYKSADEFGLIDPNEEAKKRSQVMAVWLVPFGFVAGAVFNRLTDLNTFSWAGEVGNAIIGGLLGAGAGGMGSLLAGGGMSLALGNSDSLPYRSRINSGQYLIVVQANDTVTRQASRILRRFDPDNVQWLR